MNKQKFSLIVVIICFIVFSTIIVKNFIKTYKQIEFLQNKIILLEKQCAYLHKNDTLFLNLSKSYDKNIESIIKNYNGLEIRIQKTEDDLDYLYYYD